MGQEIAPIAANLRTENGVSGVDKSSKLVFKRKRRHGERVMVAAKGPTSSKIKKREKIKEIP